MFSNNYLHSSMQWEKDKKNESSGLLSGDLASGLRVFTTAPGTILGGELQSGLLPCQEPYQYLEKSSRVVYGYLLPRQGPLKLRRRNPSFLSKVLYE